MAGYVPDWLRGSHKKSNNSTVERGKREMPSFHSGQKDHPLTQEMRDKPHTSAAYFADGGMVYMADGRDPTEAELKQMGLDASNREREAAGSPGIVEGFKNLVGRFKEGNIDDPNSLAYERYGAGRGRREFENQRAFAENAKMQGDGMRNAAMVMRGNKSAGPTVEGPKAEAVPMPEPTERKDISPKPSSEYKMDMDSMKRSSMSGGANLPKAEMESRPMGEPDRKAKPTPAPKRKAPATGTTPAGGGGGSPKRGVEKGTTPAEPSNDTRKAKPGARGGENEKRKSKPYPAEQAVQNLGKRFKEADDAYKAAPNAVNKKMRDEAKKRYENAAKGLR